MSGTTKQAWFLKTADADVFGPVGIAELRDWAADGRVAPDHQVSPDGNAWRPAPDLPELAMVWTVALTSGASYGPLNLRALRDFVRDGTVTLDAALQRGDGTTSGRVRDYLDGIFAAPDARAEADTTIATLRSDIDALQQAARDAAREREEHEQRWQEEVDRLTDACTTTRTDLDGARAEASRLARVVDKEREAHGARETDLQLEIGALTSHLEDTASELADLQKDHAARTTALGEATDRIAVLQSQLERLDVLERERDAARREIGRLRSEHDARETKLAETIAGLDKRLYAATNARDTARRAAGDNEQTLRRQQEIFDVEQAAARQREKELDEGLAEQVKLLRKETEAWEVREDNLQRKIEQLQRNCKDAVSEAAELRRELERAQQSVHGTDAGGAGPLVTLEAQAQAELKRWMQRR